MNGGSFLFERWPRFAYQHAWQVLLGTVVIIVLLGIAYSFAKGKYSDVFSVPGAESQALFDLLEQRFPATAGDTATVVIKAPAGFQDSGVKSQTQAVKQQLAALPGVSDVSSPYDTAGSISPDGTIARLTVQYNQRAIDVPKSSAQALLDLREQVSRPGFQVEAGGIIVQRAERQPPTSTEFIGISAAIVILLIAFGSVAAMGLPIATAMLGLGSGFFLVGLGAGVVSLPAFTPQFGAMIGIGVGIDYALLVTNRFREGVASGLSNEEATVKAGATAGRAVFFAGGTVVIALLGLWAAGIPAIGWVGTAGAVIVGLNVAVAVVVLPSILRLAGRYIDRWRIPFLAAPAKEAEKGFGYRLSRFVQRQPLLCGVASLVLLLLLAAPVIAIRIGSSDAGNNPTSQTSRRAYDLLSEGFGPGSNGRITVGVPIDDPALLPTVDKLPDVIKAIPDAGQVSAVRYNSDKSAAIVTVTPASAPQDRKTVDLVHRLRDTVRAQFQGSSTKPLVGGSTALIIDLGDRNASRLPIFMAAVIALSFLLLMLVFRSIAVPLKAALMNLLSIGASFGILVAIFQWGWLGGIIGVNRQGPVEAFLPMMLFAVLFGLSMDYEVFLVSQIEEHVHVRLVLVPSLMQLMGDWNWWLPGWLDRILPRVSFEGAARKTPAPSHETVVASGD